jgi:hypothetical protein
MDHFLRALPRQSRMAFATGLILALSSNAAPSAESCEHLETLASQYAGVELTSEQKQFKRKMVAWYVINCVRITRVAEPR